MAGSISVAELAYRIASWLYEDSVTIGTRLPERQLAQRFEVSRTPVIGALRLLADRGVVGPSSRGGFAVLRDVTDPAALDLGPIQPETNAVYLRLADEWSTGEVARRVTENELMRRYEVTRVSIAKVLQRAAAEGWAERLPGHGWSFVPLLTSDEAFAQLYRYRALLEPAAILEPTFVLDRPAVEASRDEQLTLFAQPEIALSPVDVFTTGSDFHRVIIQCSGNQFMIDGLDRVTRLRRLVEYRRTPNSVRWLERCQEHAAIADLLLAGERQAAADAMRAHLERAAAAKVNLRPSL